MNYKYWRLFVCLGLVTFLYGLSPVSAATAPSLGTAKIFAVLGGAAVTNTGSSVLAGDVGLWPGSAISGFPPGTASAIHTTDAVAQQAQGDVTAAYNALTSQACDFDLTGQDLGGKTLTSGVYCFSSSAQLTGTLTLDAQGNANAVFIFKMGSTITTASNSSVVMINGGQDCNIFWQVGSSATIGTTTQFAGNILALTSITMNTGASLHGRALARNGAVTLDTNRIDETSCGGGHGGGGNGGGVCTGPTSPRIWLFSNIIGPPQKVIAGVRDRRGGGLATITVLRTVNATVSIPAFKVGTTEIVFVTVTKIDQNRKASFKLVATNLNGCITKGDPVITVLKIPPFGHSVSQTFVHIPLAESFVAIVNGNLGLKSLEIAVNGTKYGRFQLEGHEAKNQELNVNVSSLMTKGENTITLTGYGNPHASALVVISDSKGNHRYSASGVWMDWQAGQAGENLVWGNQFDQ